MDPHRRRSSCQPPPCRRRWIRAGEGGGDPLPASRLSPPLDPHGGGQGRAAPGLSLEPVARSARGRAEGVAAFPLPAPAFAAVARSAIEASVDARGSPPLIAPPAARHEAGGGRAACCHRSSPPPTTSNAPCLPLATLPTTGRAAHRWLQEESEIGKLRRGEKSEKKR